MEGLHEHRLFPWDGLPAPNTLAILTSVLLRSIRFPLLNQPHLHESAQEPFPRLDGLSPRMARRFVSSSTGMLTRSARSGVFNSIPHGIAGLSVLIVKSTSSNSR